MRVTYLVAIYHTLTVFSVPESAPQLENSKYEVFCLIDIANYELSTINPDLCTHIVDNSSPLAFRQMFAPHQFFDFGEDVYEKFAVLKSKGIKVLFFIEARDNSGNDTYKEYLDDPDSWDFCITNLVNHVKDNLFEGLVLDWRLPICTEENCYTYKAKFTAFFADLHAAFKRRGFSLSLVGAHDKKSIDESYDVPALSRYSDWLIIRFFDYHRLWKKFTAHMTPLFDHPENPMDYNVNFTINYWIEKGADVKKIIPVIDFFGMPYELADRKKNGLNASANNFKGPIPFYLVCAKIKEGKWQVVRDPSNRIGPYAYSGNEWMSFDDRTMILMKSQYIEDMGLGGAMIWDLVYDDLNNTCGCETQPLLKIVNRVLRNYSNAAPNCTAEKLLQFSDDESTSEVSPRESSPKSTDEPTSTSKNAYSESKNEITSTTRMAPPEETSTRIDGPKTCDGRLFVPDEENCCRYYVCNRGVLEHRTCPQGLYWNGETCDLSQNCECHSNSNALGQKHIEFTLFQKFRIQISHGESL